jgi:hypothetical protein
VSLTDKRKSRRQKPTLSHTFPGQLSLKLTNCISATNPIPDKKYNIPVLRNLISFRQAKTDTEKETPAGLFPIQNYIFT